MNIPKISLDDVCESKISTLSSLYNGIIEYIDISSIDNVEKKVSSTQLMDAKIAPSRAKQLVQSGDILVSTVRPNLNAVAIINQESAHLLVASTGYCILRCNKEINSRYVFYFCQSPYFIGQMTLQASGASYPAVTSSIVKKTLIPFYSIERQNYIVSVLDKLTTLISLRKQQLTKLDELVKARFVEMFGDPIENTHKWNIYKLIDICVKLTDGTHFSPESYKSGDYRYVTAKNIRIGGFDFTNITYVTQQIHNSVYTRCNPEYGDVLYIKDGVTTGIAIVNSLHEPFTMLSSVALLKHNRNLINGEYLCALLNNQNMYRFIRSNMGGAAITRLTISKLNEIKIPVPPLNLQNNFASFITEINKSKLTIQFSLDKMELLKKMLMQKFFG